MCTLTYLKGTATFLIKLNSQGFILQVRISLFKRNFHVHYQAEKGACHISRSGKVVVTLLFIIHMQDLTGL